METPKEQMIPVDISTSEPFRIVLQFKKLLITKFTSSSL
jgi:hypothetical protein